MARDPKQEEFSQQADLVCAFIAGFALAMFVSVSIGELVR